MGGGGSLGVFAGSLQGQPTLPAGKHGFGLLLLMAGGRRLGDVQREIHLESSHESEAGGRNRSYDPLFLVTDILEHL